MLGSKVSDAPESDGFTVSFIHLELRRGHRGDDRKAGGSGTGSLKRARALLRAVKPSGGREKRRFKAMLT